MMVDGQTLIEGEIDFNIYFFETNIPSNFGERKNLRLRTKNGEKFGGGFETGGLYSLSEEERIDILDREIKRLSLMSFREAFYYDMVETSTD